MKIRKTYQIFFAAIFLILIIQLNISADEYRFTHLSIEDGLSNNSVFKILQDSKGFMWFATFSGLNRYDGMDFTVFKPIANDPFSISSSVIFELFEDSDGQIWIGTDGGGLNKYNYASNSFLHYGKNGNNDAGIGSTQVYAINEDSQGFLWVGTDGGGITVLNRKTLSFVRFTADDGISGLQSNTIRCIFRDSNDTIWVGTEGGGLSRYDTELGGFRTYRSNPKNSSSLTSDTVRVIFEDNSGTIWIGTEGGGLVKYLTETDSFKRITLENTISVRAIAQDSLGYLWIGTEGNGIMILNPLTLENKNIRKNKYNSESLSYNKIRAIQISENGIIWIGTRGGGINKYNMTNLNFTLYTDNMSHGISLSDSNIRQIYEDSFKRILVCTDGGGINIIENGIISGVIRNKPSTVNSLCSDHVCSVIEDSSGYFWFGTDDEGLDRYNPRSNTFKHFTSNPQNPASISSNVVWSLFEDSFGILWAGTEGGGLNRYDRDTQTFEKFTYDPNNPNSLLGSSVHSIFEDSQKRLWIGTWDGGVNLYKGNGIFQRFWHDPNNPDSISDGSINCITEDSQKRIWVGTAGGGINLFNEKSGSFTHYSIEDGLAGDNVFGILEDSEKNLWISTDNGISKFNVPLGLFINYSKEDGLQKNEFTYNAFLKTSDGKFFFGGTNGVNSFYPEKIKNSSSPSNITITKIKVYDLLARSQYGISNSPYKTYRPYELSTLELSHKNLVTFEFALLDFLAPDRNRYSVKLEGLDDDWQPLGLQHNITYSNLQPGDYVFRVKGLNSKGIWSVNEEKIQIIVHPPFYMTIWFYLIIVLFTGTLAIILYKMRTRSLKRQNKDLANYAAHIVHAREEERKSVARDVHDQLGQILTVLKIDLFWMKKHIDQKTDILLEKIESSIDLAAVSLEFIKKLSSRLRPNVLDNLSLSEAVKWLIDDFTSHNSEVDYKASFYGNIFKVDTETKTSIFRIIQELLTNTIKHSQATKVKVDLTYTDSKIIIKVRDNGIGISNSKIDMTNSFGIMGIRERCNFISAKLNIESPGNKGTTVTVTVPYDKKLLEKNHG